MKYAYPAVFTEENDGYAVDFPDLEGCYTCGDNLEDAIVMAEDALALTLYNYEKESKAIPAPSDRKSIALEKEEFVNYIACDTIEYQKMHSTKAVKKTLTIPEWLNEAASAKGINFSAVLQKALKEQLDL